MSGDSGCRWNTVTCSIVCIDVYRRHMCTHIVSAFSHRVWSTQCDDTLTDLKETKTKPFRLSHPNSAITLLDLTPFSFERPVLQCGFAECFLNAVQSGKGSCFFFIIIYIYINSAPLFLSQIKIRVMPAATEEQRYLLLHNKWWCASLWRYWIIRCLAWRVNMRPHNSK